ncbi:hypothetical protein EBR21_11480 [bacterium]|nr:hypothetical protein [bacterium]
MDKFNFASAILMSLFVSACGVRYYPVQSDPGIDSSYPTSTLSSSDTDYDSLGNNMWRAPVNACLLVANVNDLIPRPVGLGYFECRDLEIRTRRYIVAKIHCRRDVCILVDSPKFE